MKQGYRMGIAVSHTAVSIAASSRADDLNDEIVTLLTSFNQQKSTSSGRQARHHASKTSFHNSKGQMVVDNYIYLLLVSGGERFARCR